MATPKYSAGVPSEIRTSFRTKEGDYRVVLASQYSRPSRQPLLGKELSQVQVSFVSCKDKEGLCEWLAFNSARELYFYKFEGVGKSPDLRRPIDKRVYKSPTIPVAHDFNQLTRSTSRLDLIVGFSTGPLQYLNPLEKKSNCAFNEDGSVDSTKVTCVKWVPASETTFVSSHRSGNLFVWTTEFSGKTTGPQNYVPYKEIQDATIHTVKPKNKSPIVYRWSIGHGAINSFAFSPDVTHIAIVSQDGFLRVYNFKTQELYGRMRSYFGGLLCVCWSPDGRYIVTGGEDDLVTVWSFEHRRVVARGEGHKSYISVVAFDPYTTVLPNSDFSMSCGAIGGVGSERGTGHSETTSQSRAFNGLAGDRGSGHKGTDSKGRASSDPTGTASSPFLGRSMSEAADRERNMVAYRLGSVGQDTMLCLWDLSGDTLKLRRPFSRNRSRMSRITSRPISGAEFLESISTEPRKREQGEAEGARDRVLGNSSDVLADSEDRSKSTPLSSITSSSGSPKRRTSKASAVANHVPPSHSKASNSATSESVPKNVSRTSLAENRSTQHEVNPRQSLTSVDKKGSPVDDKESSPASEQSSSEKGNGKKEKKAKKDKDGKTTKIKEPVKKMMKFVGIGGSSHHVYHRMVGNFETCNSDDIAAKMPEVNLMEPLIAKKISHERLSALVFREDCIVTANQEGLVQTWARPSTVLPTPAEEVEEHSRPSSRSAPANPPGLNSPRPGGGPETSMKTTTV